MSSEHAAWGTEQHNGNYVVFICLNYKAQSFDFSPVFRTGGHDINPRGINAAVPQDVRQLGDVFLNAVKGPGKQFAKIVRKHLEVSCL